LYEYHRATNPDHPVLFSGDAPLAIEREEGTVYKPEVTAKTVKAIIGTAAFAGLRQGEVRGLWWEDDDGDVLSIRRSVWRSHLKDTKTHEDEDDPGVVPLIQPLRDMLDSVRPDNAFGFIFANRSGGALDLENLAHRVIKPVLKANGLVWKGWHAYRRGLATNLNVLGVPDNIIQGILRHENVSTTHRYIKRVPTEATNAMKRLEAQIDCSAVVPQPMPRVVVNYRN
jgi:integrase